MYGATLKRSCSCIPTLRKRDVLCDRRFPRCLQQHAVLPGQGHWRSTARAVCRKVTRIFGDSMSCDARGFSTDEFFSQHVVYRHSGFERVQPPLRATNVLSRRQAVFPLSHLEHISSVLDLSRCARVFLHACSRTFLPYSSDFLQYIEQCARAVTRRFSMLLCTPRYMCSITSYVMISVHQ